MQSFAAKGIPTPRTLISERRSSCFERTRLERTRGKPLHFSGVVANAWV